MFLIQYKLSNYYEQKVIKDDDMFLRYDFFCGSISFKTLAKSIEFNWEWIPILDFAAALKDLLIKLTLEHSEMEVFDFTESADELIISNKNDKITLLSTFSNEKLDMSFDEFHNGVTDFYKTVINDIVNKYPNIILLKEFQKYFKEDGKIIP